MPDSHVYHPPQQFSALPASLVAYLDGKDLRPRVGQAIQVLTVGEDGRAHGALLSAGEILAIDGLHVNFAISPNSTTERNIQRSGQVAFALVHGGKLYELQLSARLSGEIAVGHNNAAFTATVETVKAHSVPYAELQSGPTYTLKDPEAVLNRWNQQIAALRALV